ncbi:cellulase [Paralcaligenes sp. KSB-10]|uniref:cellulose synthase complex periplasmic endoglucanase BcsZ n=1 Tax=Paralcaligenes sp. KSB-10 TaxID=2901142 RepID=UPI001E52F333|nr:cellulose synthase complex periplasmic endoglucanase BcsZ [Paralcaligenes sp. KSB-10]UHL64433.1 cellulase [Paralcaligenes sp. KSB-10]
MKAIGLILALLLPLGSSLAGECTWAGWEAFKQNLISSDGRVMDPSTATLMTTSEGQSYAMFFALAANDRVMFRRLLRWTEDNLAGGDMTSRLPSWSWGKLQNGNWGILDHNSASDADLWIAYSLLEAGRLWNEHGYAALGTLLIQRIAREEVVEIPGLGVMLLPGKTGFASDGAWRLNPSYLPPQVLARLSSVPGPWAAVMRNAFKLLEEATPRGYAPDWVSWQTGRGWQTDAQDGSRGSYNAIRVYLWIGMLHAGSAEKTRLLAHFAPMAELVSHNGVPPETINTLTGQASGVGPSGFSAALLPFLAGTPAAAMQRTRLARRPPGARAYYDQVLTLFGEGWDRHHFRFDEAGRLIPAWTTCAH